MSDDLLDELHELAETPWLNTQARIAFRSAAREIERLRADRVTVAPDRRTLIRVMNEAQRATASGILGLEGLADALLASGVFGVPADA